VSSDLDALIDEMDGQVCMLGRLFSARHEGAHGQSAPGHGLGSEGHLSMSQYMFLRVLHTEGPMKMADIATMLGIKAPAVSAIVDAAERAGHVEREHDADDRRVTLVCLTDSGTAALTDAENLRREMLRRYTSVLSEDDLRSLIRIQQILIDAMVTQKI
jgi:DNA-binding MarR family transcriptional regulator